MFIALRSAANGKYVCAENTGAAPLIANRGQIGQWETFEMVPTGPNTVVLRSAANWKFVCADNAGASPLIANRDNASIWETFEKISVGGGVAFRSAANGKYVCAENNGANSLIANRSAADQWETFFVEPSTVMNQEIGSSSFSPTIHYSDARGYSYNETSSAWGRICSQFPCFLALQWPDYATTIVEANIDGQPVVIQLWKGWCQKFLGLNAFPGGVGGEVGVYRRMPGRARPKSLPFLPQPLASLILGAIGRLTDDQLWWPFPELNAAIEFTLTNPVTRKTFFQSGPGQSFWSAKWMDDLSYLKYQNDQKRVRGIPFWFPGNSRTPFFSVKYIMDFKINGKSYRAPW